MILEYKNLGKTSHRFSFINYKDLKGQRFLGFVINHRMIRAII